MADLAAKTERLNLRTTSTQNTLIRRAATLKGQNVTDFVLSSAIDNAKRAIDEFEQMSLNMRDRVAFVDALLNPPAPTAKALVAAARYKKLSRA